MAAVGLLLVYDGLTTAARNRSPLLYRRLQRVVQASEVEPSALKRLTAAACAAAFGSFLVVAGLTSSFVVAAVSAVGAAWTPFALARARRARRRRRFREAWPDAISSLISALRAGVSLQEACASLSERGPEDLKPAFGGFRSAYRATGSFRSALERLRLELSDPVADRMVAALKLAEEVGGPDLVRLLRALGDFVRDDLRVRKEIEARWSWTVTAARVAAGAPWVVLLLMSTRPEAAAAYNSPAGTVVILVGVALTLVGYRFMLAAARLPEEPRLEA